MDSYIKLIEKLSNAHGTSGFEDDVVEVIKNNLNKTLKVNEDSTRNTYIESKESIVGPIIMLDGHSDEVGFIVQAIKDNGLLKFLPVGGWIPYNASAQKVKIKNVNGTYISGVVSSKPPHFMSDSDRKKPVTFDNLFIDVGASSKAEVIHDFNISVGCPITPDVTLEHNLINNTLIGKAFDNRLGCACVIELMNSLNHKELKCKVVGAIAAQEEIGTRGAVITSNTVKPDIAIVFEGTPADDGFKPSDEAQSVLKKGPQIRHIDRGMITNPRFVKFAREIAFNEKIDFQDAIRSGGGTNGAKIHLSNQGVPTIVIGVPVRYIHTHYGITAIKDFDSAIQWAKAIIKNIDQEIINTF